MDTFKWGLIVFGSFAAIFFAFRLWNRDTRGAYLLGLLVLLFGLVFFSGCAVSPERKPWMEVGLGYDVSDTVGNNPQCIVRIKQPIGFGKLEPDWLTIGYNHQSSCPDKNDREVVDSLELIAKIPLGRR